MIRTIWPRLLSLLLAASSLTPARVAAADRYPALPGLPRLTGYRLLVNGVETPIYDTASGRFCLIRSAGRINVQLDGDQGAISTALLRPLEREQAPVVSQGSVQFSLVGRSAVALEIDGDQDRPIFFLLRPPDSPPSPDAVTYFFEAGKIHDLPGGTLRLQSGESVYIADGAVVRGKIEAIGSREDPVRNVRIGGGGVLQGPREGRALAIIRGTGSKINGLTVLGTNGWTTRLFETTDTEVRNVNILASGRVCDGIDILGGHDITVSDSLIRSDDDGIAIKGSKWNFGGNVERVTLQDLVIWNGPAGNGIEIGYELGVDQIRDITARQIAIIRTDAKKEYTLRRAVLSIHNSGHAEVRDILYEDITIEQARENLFYLWCGVSRFAEHSGRPASIRDVTYRRVRYIDGPAVPSVIEAAAPGSVIEGITFEECTYLGHPMTSPGDFHLRLRHAALPRFK